MLPAHPSARPPWIIRATALIGRSIIAPSAADTRSAALCGFSAEPRWILEHASGRAIYQKGLDRGTHGAGRRLQSPSRCDELGNSLCSGLRPWAFGLCETLIPPQWKRQYPSEWRGVTWAAAAARDARMTEFAPMNHSNGRMPRFARHVEVVGMLSGGAVWHAWPGRCWPSNLRVDCPQAHTRVEFLLQIGADAVVPQRPSRSARTGIP